MSNYLFVCVQGYETIDFELLHLFELIFSLQFLLKSAKFELLSNWLCQPADFIVCALLYYSKLSQNLLNPFSVHI